MGERLGRDAGQVEDLVDRLRGLIRDYPLGVGLIKEFLQNADDAGASWVRFTLDERTLDTARLPDPRMGPLVGPSLLVTSDQVFSASDLVAIQRLQEGHKRSDASTTGRFGLGFNSVYNITDYPSFATDSVIMTFDPHRDAVAQESGRPGWTWPLDELWGVAPDWPAAFGLRDGVDRIAETTFRLPLRTTSQCGQGRLGRRPVSAKDISALLEEIAESWAGSLLLFLRHVLHIELCVVDKAGRRRWQASVRTSNEDEVRNAREQHAAPLAGRSVDEIWSEWEKHPDGPREVLYEHRFRVSRLGREGATEAWLVAQGAGLRSQRRLFDSAANLLMIEEKPLPLVGAACRLPDAPGGSLPDLDGRLYCTLPLPDPIGVPFHINAFVDLDSSRRGPTASDDLAGNALLRKRWNEVLLQDLVPVVAARLLGEVANRAAARQLTEDASYRLCPRTRGGRVRWAEEMVESLLERFATVPFVMHQSRDRLTLRAVDDTRLAPSIWSADLRKAVVFDGFDIAHPPPPHDLLRSFSDVGVEFEEVDPDDFCDWLQEVEGNLWSSLKHAPRKCLRTELRLRSVIRFCSKRDRASLDGLPLGLRQDGTLVRFGAGDLVTFFGWPTFCGLFPTRPHWFWGAAVQEEVRPSQVSSSTLNAETTVINLKTYLRDGSMAWDRQSEAPPNEIWLTELLRFLSREALTSNAVRVLRRLALLPASDGQLRAPSGDEGVMFGVPPGLRAGVERLGWRCVEASGPLLQAVEQMARKHREVVPRCDAEEVRKLLVTSAGEGLAKLADAEMRSLADYVAKAWDEEELEDLDGLGEVPFWVTVGGGRVSADTPNTFLAIGFTPPPGLVSYRVVEQAPTLAVRRLQKDLGLRELTPETFAATLGTVLADNGPEGDAARTWLVEQNWRHWSKGTTKVLRGNLRVPDQNGHMRSPPELFDPRQKSSLELFGGRLHIPSERYSSEEWLYFLGNLGMRQRLDASDLVGLVDSWSEEGAGTESYDALLAWLGAAFERADGERKELAALEELVEPLQDKRWISTTARAALSDADTRASRLRIPSGCVEHAWLDLVGESAPVMPRQVRATLRDALGVLARPTREQVLQQFEIATRREGDAKKLERYASMLLRWVQTEDEVPVQLLNTAWIPAAAGRYRPDKVFFEDVRFSAGFLAQPAPNLAKSREAALKKIGVRARPDIDALVGLLQDLAAAADSEGVVVEVAGHAYQRLERLFRELADEWPARDVTRRWLAPTRDGRFLPLHQVVLDDAPWLATTLKAARVPWLHESVSPGFADIIGARRASAAIRQEMVNGVGPGEVPTQLPRLQALVGDGAFRSALQRLLRHLLSDRGREELLRLRDEVRQVRVEIRAYESLTVRWSLDGFALADSDEDVFVVRACDTISISVAGDEKRWHVMVARGLAEGLGCKELFNDAALEEMLRASPGDDLHKLLDGRRIPADPDAVEAVVAPLPEREPELDEEVDPHESALEGDALSNDDTAIAEQVSGTTVDDADGESEPVSRGEVHVREHTRSLPDRRASRGGPSADVSVGQEARPQTRAVREKQEAEDVESPNRTDGTELVTPRGQGAGYHWVEGHLRRNPSSTDAVPAGWERHATLGHQVQEARSRPGSAAADEAQRPSGATKRSSPMRGAVRVVPDGAFRPGQRFKRVVRALGDHSGARRVEYPNGKNKKEPEIWLTRKRGGRVAVFCCVLDGSWDDQLPDLRASAMEMLHKKGRGAELWVVEHVNGADRLYKLHAPLQEAYTFRFGRQTRGKVNNR